MIDEIVDMSNQGHGSILMHPCQAANSKEVRTLKLVRLEHRSHIVTTVVHDPLLLNIRVEIDEDRVAAICNAHLVITVCHIPWLFLLHRYQFRYFLYMCCKFHTHF